MPIRFFEKSPELTLIFNRSTMRLSNQQIKLLGETLGEVEGVESVRTRSVWFRRQQIRVIFDSQTEPNAILRKMASALRAPAESSPSSPNQALSDRCESQNFSSGILLKTANVRLAEPAPSNVINKRDDVHSPKSPDVRHRLREVGYGILTIGSFGMSWVGLIVPGIPTVPFVLLTAHFALQASPTLRDRLLKSRFFGRMMRDWQDHRAIRRDVQIQAYAFTIVICVVGFAFAPPILLLYAGMGIASAMGLYAISQIPVIESSEDGQSVIQVSGFLKKPAIVA